MSCFLKLLRWVSDIHLQSKINCVISSSWMSKEPWGHLYLWTLTLCLKQAFQLCCSVTGFVNSNTMLSADIKSYSCYYGDQTERRLEGSGACTGNSAHPMVRFYLAAQLGTDSTGRVKSHRFGNQRWVVESSKDGHPGSTAPKPQVSHAKFLEFLIYGLYGEGLLWNYFLWSNSDVFHVLTEGCFQTYVFSWITTCWYIFRTVPLIPLLPQLPLEQIQLITSCGFGIFVPIYGHHKLFVFVYLCLSNI